MMIVSADDESQIITEFIYGKPLEINASLNLYKLIPKEV